MFKKFSESIKDRFNKTKKRIYQKNLRLFTRIIEKYPNNAIAYSIRGTTKRNLGDYQGTIDDYNKSIELYPNAKTFHNRAEAKGSLGDYKGAIQDYNKALELYPDFADAYGYRGEAKDNLGDFEGDRKSTRLNSSHLGISYAVFCLKKKKTNSAVLVCLDATLVCSTQYPTRIYI